MNQFQRIDRVVAHLERFATHDQFYRSLLRQWELLGRLSEKQMATVERNMEKDIKWLYDWEVFAIRKWNEEHQDD